MHFLFWPEREKERQIARYATRLYGNKSLRAAGRKKVCEGRIGMTIKEEEGEDGRAEKGRKTFISYRERERERETDPPATVFYTPVASTAGT